MRSRTPHRLSDRPRVTAARAIAVADRAGSAHARRGAAATCPVTRRIDRLVFSCNGEAGLTRLRRGVIVVALRHDPEKWEAAFGKDHAQTKCQGGITTRPKIIPFCRRAKITAQSARANSNRRR